VQQEELVGLADSMGIQQEFHLPKAGRTWENGGLMVV